MSGIALAGDYIGLLCFSIAFVMVALTREIAGVRLPALTKALLLCAIFVYVVVTVEEPLGALGLHAFIAPLSDNVETLFPFFVVGGIFSAYFAAQYDDMARTKQALEQSHELMGAIVDAAPAGIVFLDATGHVEFANDTAREILEIAEDPATGGLDVPGWVLAGVDDARPGNLAPLVSDTAFDARSVWLTWPCGRTIGLHVSGRPLADARGALGGIVVTFDRPHQVVDVAERVSGAAG